MQPYQKASEEIKKHQQLPTQALGTAASVAGSIVGGGAIAKRVLPFLSQYIPADLMRKGLSKLDPRFGKFIDGALNHGYNIDEVRGFMEEKFSQPGQSTQQVSSSNPLQDFETNYPEVAGALSRTIQNGQSPDAAAAILKNSTSFSKEIKKLEKEVGKNFVDYVLELFGNQSQQMQQPENFQQMQGQPQQGSNVDAQLMAALDKILKM